MKTDIEIKDILYSIIKGSTLDGIVTGEVYKDSRPTNSKKEDILISVLDGDNGQYQKVILNINIYTQDIKRKSDNIENATRIRLLSRIVIDLLHGDVCDKYLIEVEKQRTFEIKETAEHVINTRLLLTYINF